MKNLCLFFVALGFCFFTFPINAQEFDASRALSDYVYNLNIYRTAYDNYVNAKKEFKNYQTLTSETKALEVTKIFLNQRATTVKTYLTAVRMKLKESTSIINYEQNYLFIKIDDEVAWIPTHQVEYNSAGTIPDLLKISTVFQTRYPEEETLAYKALGQIVFQEETDLTNETNNLIKKTEAKIAQMRELGEDTTVEERWLIQAKEKVKRSDEKRNAALVITNSLKAGNKNKLASWNQAQVLYVEGNQYLKEACSNLREILREVKSAN